MSDHFAEALKLAVQVAAPGEQPYVTIGRAIEFLQFLRGVLPPDEDDDNMDPDA